MHAMRPHLVAPRGKRLSAGMPKVQRHVLGTTAPRRKHRERGRQTQAPRPIALVIRMPNERTTEDIVRQHLKKYGVAGQIVEEQSSDDPKIKKALAKASKSDGGGAG